MNSNPGQFSEHNGSNLNTNTTSHSSNSSVVEVDEILKDLIPDFMSRRHQEFDLMKKLLAAHDFQGLAQYGHKLKGSSLNYGFQHLGGLAAQLESAAFNKNTGLLEKLISEIENHVQNVQIVYVG